MDTWRDLWRMVRAGLIAIGVLLSFFVIIEQIRVFEVLYSLHPIVGILFVLLLIIGVVAGGGYFVVPSRQYPPVLLSLEKQSCMERACSA